MTELFLAWRYLAPKRDAVSAITCISLLGVMLGVAVLVVVTSVMSGFIGKMQDTLLATISHVQVSNPHGDCIADCDEVVKAVKECGGSPLRLIKRECIIQAGELVAYKFLIGVDSSMEHSPFNLKENIEHHVSENKDSGRKVNYGRYELSQKKVIISKVIADELNLSVGDRLIVHSPEKLQEMVQDDETGRIGVMRSDKVYLPEEFAISGLYDFDKRDFDKNIIFLDIDDAADLYELPRGAATNVYVWTGNPFKVETFMHQLQLKLPYLRIVSWKQLEHRILNMLSLQKVIMIFLFAFIVMVSAICVMCTMITVVVQKRREIGVMKSFGATSASIVKIFSFQGGLVGIVGTSLGIGMGLMVIAYRNELVAFASRVAGRSLWNPDFYFFKDLPAVVNGMEVAVIGTASVLLCICGAVLPALLAAFVEPAKAIRSE